MVKIKVLPYLDEIIKLFIYFQNGSCDPDCEKKSIGSCEIIPKIIVGDLEEEYSDKVAKIEFRDFNITDVAYQVTMALFVEDSDLPVEVTVNQIKEWQKINLSQINTTFTGPQLTDT